LRRAQQFLALGTVLLIGLAVYLLALLSGFDVPTQASIWVAVGTLALAATTVVSILETRQVLLGEEKRFQQSVAPFVVVSPLADADGHFIGFKTKNAGKGLARNVRVRIEAFYYPDGIDETEDIGLVLDALEKDTEARRWVDNAVVAVVAEGATESAYFAGPNVEQPPLSDTLIRRIEIDYLDMFGNEYRSTTEKYYEYAYEWNPPKRYKVGRT
jgi:hypothetical protein